MPTWPCERLDQDEISKCTTIVVARFSFVKHQMNGKSIPYTPNPTFLGITFDERLTFKVHFENLRIRALKRLNIIKIFSHKSWHLNKATLTNIYRALMGSIFDYSLFIVACCSNLCIDRIQTTQNRAIRCIYRCIFSTQHFKIQTNAD